MRLKSIRPTDGVKQVEFGELKSDWDRTPERKTARPNRVLTPDHGWQPVLDFQKIKTGPTVVVSRGDDELICDPMHRMQSYFGGKWTWAYAGDLPGAGFGTGHYLRSVSATDCFKRFSDGYTVTQGAVEDLYDIEIPAPHAYYTSGFVSHNSIMLCNNAIHQTQSGRNTLLVTFELSDLKTAARCMGSLTDVALNNFLDHREMVADRVRRTFDTAGAHLVIAELPPDECSVNDVYAIIRRLKRTKGWIPECVVIDYLELMVGRRETDNRDDYSRQKAVANQIRGLAKNENVLVFTATQTNRAGNNTEKLIDLTNVAESYGKTMPLDYIISLNQSDEDRRKSLINMFINKNRNGPKHEQILCEVNYKTMHLKEKPY